MRAETGPADDAPGDVAAAVATRSAEVVEALRALGDDELQSPSELPGWTRLTIACHLRYGAEALRRMTRAAVAGEPATYYPGGRRQQRPGTLVPADGERPVDVVESLATRCHELDRTWAALDADGWATEVVEPPDQPDLGTVGLRRLALLRLTEVEVHGSDLGLGLDEWSDLFVRLALPFRLDWLTTRRSNDRPVDDDLDGSWLIVASDGPTYLVTLTDGTVDSHPSSADVDATAVIEGSSPDLLALLLGRAVRAPLTYRGDEAFGRAFPRAFPGP